jgi:thiamine pyrophosphokinase
MRDAQPAETARAVVLADGTPPTSSGLDAAWPGWREGVAFVVAADGGLHLAEPLGLTIDLWVGDADSVRTEELDRLQAAGIPIELARPDKDESDTELAVVAAAARSTDVTILGGIGGARLDHTIANLGVLAHPALRGRAARLLQDEVRVTLLVGEGRPVVSRLRGRVGDVVSLLPLDARVEGVTTDGLLYPLRNEPLEAGPARGLSNVRTTETTTVTLRRGRLLIVETPATLTE